MTGSSFKFFRSVYLLTVSVAETEPQATRSRIILMDLEPQRDAAPAPMALPPNLIIKKVTNLGLWKVEEQKPHQIFLCVFFTQERMPHILRFYF
jgi:hypothetical protein